MRQAKPWYLDMGAFVTSHAIRFRVWVQQAQRVEVELVAPEERLVPMQRDHQGVWTAELPGHGAGMQYKYRLNGEASLPDPYSRSQPGGVHGASEVVDPTAYTWSDQAWQGIDMPGLVIYECHIGTATTAGTCDALIDHLERLQRLGVGAIELMPVAAFPGRRNWGYDGVYPFAVSANYGGPAGLKRLVDAAHQCGLGVILDVVYNHLGPEGNYFRQFSPSYFSARHRTPWGEAMNYDGPHNHRVRQLAIDNACYWLHEYHIDGLRLDATSKMFDDSQPHILQELTQTVRKSLPSGRSVVLIAETSENDVRYLVPAEEGGYGFDAVWADDLYWSLRRYMTGDHEGRYQDHQGTLDEVAQTMNHGFLYEGQWSSYLRSKRGTPARQQPAWKFQYCLQHHDHVGNRAFGDRLHHQIGLDLYRVASALVLLLPYTPLLFMGQEFAASTPFLFFTDHSAELGRRVARGRRREFAVYAAFANPAVAARIPDPQADETFQRSCLPVDELTRSPGVEMQTLYQALLQLRRTDPVLGPQHRHIMQAQAVSPDCLAVVWQEAQALRLLLANFGGATSLHLADLVQRKSISGWQVILETSERRFGGSGASSLVRDDRLHLAAHTAALIGNATEL